MQKIQRGIFTSLIAIASLVATSFAGVSANADSADKAILVASNGQIVRAFNSSHVLTVQKNESISINFNASILSSLLPDASGVAVVFDPHFATTGTASYENKSVSISNGSPDGGSNTTGASITKTSTEAWGFLNLMFHYTGNFSTAGTVTFNPTLSIGGVSKDLTSAMVVEDTDTTNVNIYPMNMSSGPSTGPAKVTTSAIDAKAQFYVPTVCVDTAQLSDNDVLTLAATINNGTTDVTPSTISPNWYTWDPNDESVGTGASTNGWDIGTKPSGSTWLLGVGAVIAVNSPGAKTYTLKSIKVTKNGQTTNLLTECGSYPTGKTITVTQRGTIMFVSANFTDPTGHGNYYGNLVCAIYATSDTNHSTALSSGQGYASGTNSNCYLKAPAAGTYVVGVRHFQDDNNPGITTEQYLTGVVSKKAPTVPTLAAKSVKVGKSYTYAMPKKGTSSAAFNKESLATTMTYLSMGMGPGPAPAPNCSVAAVKSGGKVSGYKVTGLVVGTCQLSLSITGNATYANGGGMVLVTVTR